MDKQNWIGFQLEEEKEEDFAGIIADHGGTKLTKRSKKDDQKSEVELQKGTEEMVERSKAAIAVKP